MRLQNVLYLSNFNHRIINGQDFLINSIGHFRNDFSAQLLKMIKSSFFFLPDLKIYDF